MIKYIENKIYYIANDAEDGFNKYFEENNTQRSKLMKDKLHNLGEITNQHICLKYIIEKNKKRNENIPLSERIPFPFTVIKHKSPVVDIQSNNNFNEVNVSSFQPFEVQQDYSFVNELGIIKLSPEEVVKYIPPEYLGYVPSSVVKKDK